VRNIRANGVARLGVGWRGGRHDQEDGLPTGRVVVVKSYTVTAKRWKHGWELHIDDVGVTQSRTLAAAEQMVRDYAETLLDIDASDAEVVIVPELGGLEDRARQVREHAKAAEEARREAAREARELAAALRAEGLSISDTAAVLGISRGRVSQLVKSA
jgi:hypothetical protein